MASSSGRRSAATQAHGRTASVALLTSVNVLKQLERYQAGLVDGQEAGRQKRIVELVGIAWCGLLFAAHALDRGGIERAELRRARLAGAPRVDGMSPPLLQRRIVEEGIRPRVEDLVGERRRLRRVASDETQLPAVDAFEHARQPGEVHRLLQAVAHRLADERVIRNLPVARDVLEAGRRVGEDRGHQIVREHALELRRHFLAAAIARDGERDGRIPPPACLKDRGVEKCLHQHVARGCGVQVPEHIGQWKRMLRPQREQEPFLRRRGLKLEVELAAEALAQREAPGLVDAAPERRVQDQLHAARLVEESFEHERVLRRQNAERFPSLGEIRDRLFGGVGRQASFGSQPGDDWVRRVRDRCWVRGEAAIDFRAQVADGCGQLVAPAGRLAEPEREYSAARPWRRRRGRLPRRPAARARTRCPS